MHQTLVIKPLLKPPRTAVQCSCVLNHLFSIGELVFVSVLGLTSQWPGHVVCACVFLLPSSFICYRCKLGSKRQTLRWTGLVSKTLDASITRWKAVWRKWVPALHSSLNYVPPCSTFLMGYTNFNFYFTTCSLFYYFYFATFILLLFCYFYFTITCSRLVVWIWSARLVFEQRPLSWVISQ